MMGLDAILRPTPSAITTPPGPHRHTASTVRAAHAALRVPPEDVLPGRRGIAISVCRTPLGSVLKAAFDDLNDAVRRGSHRFSSFFRAIYFNIVSRTPPPLDSALTPETMRLKLIADKNGRQYFQAASASQMRRPVHSAQRQGR